MPKESQSGFRQKIKELKKPRRFVVLNDETFEQEKSYRLSALNLYILLCTVLLLISALVVSLIFYTPLRKSVPGYRDIRKDETFVELNKQIEALEETIGNQDTYISALKHRMTEDVQSMARTQEQISSDDVDPIAVQKTEEEMKLRREIQRQKVLQKQEDAKSKMQKSIFVLPVNGSVSYEFMPEQEHFGLDIIAPENSAILAAADGFVMMSDWTESQGNTIGIAHDDNTITFYKHNSALLKKVGSFVSAGEAIAIIGNSGKLTDGPHLHFEIWIDGKPVDPELYLNF